MTECKNTKRTHLRPRIPARIGPLSTCPNSTYDAHKDRPDAGPRCRKRQTNPPVAPISPRTHPPPTTRARSRTLRPAGLNTALRFVEMVVFGPTR